MAGATFGPGITGATLVNLPEHDLRLREAALVLHGLHWRDRLWLLRRLMPGWRRSLRAMLRELRQIGIEPSFGSCQEIPAVLALPGLDATALALVDQATPQRMRALLASEPTQVQAWIFCLWGWRWRAAVWKDMSGLQRRRLRAAMPADDNPRAGVGTALLASLAWTLQGDHPASAALAEAVP